MNRLSTQIVALGATLALAAPAFGQGAGTSFGGTSTGMPGTPGQPSGGAGTTSSIGTGAMSTGQGGTMSGIGPGATSAGGLSGTVPTPNRGAMRR